MANSYLNRTVSSASNRRTFTFSAWVKRSKLGTAQSVIGADSGGGTNFGLQFQTNDTLAVFQGASTFLITTQVFRDTSAWSHLVLAVDTTNSTADNRVRLYNNGIEITSFGTRNNPSVNTDLAWNNNVDNTVGADKPTSGVRNYFDGYISHAANVDGQQLTPTTFGQTDSTSGIWKFKSPSGVTWGTNGFHLKFENSAALGTDSSGNSNTFTVNGNLKQALDTPSNVHCTMNALDKSYSGTAALSNGNTTVTGDGTWQNMRLGTIGVNTGKWYWEMKINSGNNANIHFGIVPETWNMNYSSAYYGQTGYYAFYIGGEKYANGSSSSGSGTFTNGDIVGIALDLDSATKTLSVYQNTQVSGSVVNLDATFDGQFWRPMFMGNNSSATAIGDFNFGNGFFGTTAITSAGSNGNGSLFEYDVPSGYYAINTKNLNTYG
jgi:hypothetical protein